MVQILKANLRRKITFKTNDAFSEEKCAKIVHCFDVQHLFTGQGHLCRADPD